MGTGKVHRREVVDSSFEIVSPAEGGMCELDPMRILMVGSGPAGFVSEDSCRTWSAPFPFIQGGKALLGGTLKKGILRLHNGELGMVYGKQVDVPLAAGYRTRSYCYATSDDNGEHWSDGFPLDMPVEHDEDKGVFQYPWGNLTQLSTGRLLVPAYWSFGGRNPEVAHGFLFGGAPATDVRTPTATIGGARVTRAADGHTYEAAIGGCFVYHSDNGGRTWERCTGSVTVWPLPGEENEGGFGAAHEPVVIELRDGRVLMLVRTTAGRIFQSYSEDGGEHWSLATPTMLASGDVPCWIGRLRTTGDLLVVWNQSSVDEIRNGYSRGRLSAAISRDEAKSWENHRTVVLSAGMEDVARVELPPVKHVRARLELGVLPDDFSRNDYPQLAFVQGNVIIKHSRAQYAHGERFRVHILKVVPEEWFYR